MLLAQTDAPEPLLPETSVPIWSNIALLVVVLTAMAVVAWRAWKYLLDTRRTADEALEAATQMSRQSAESP